MTDAREATLVSPTSDDLDELVRLWTRLVASQRAFGTSLRVDENQTAAREWLAQALVMDRLRAATVEGSLVGFVSYEMEIDRFAREKRTGLVPYLFVDRAFRGEGIGSMLLSCAEERLRERGADRIRLEVLAANERAGSFYADRGFHPHRVQYLKPLEETDKANSPGHEE